MLSLESSIIVLYILVSTLENIYVSSRIHNNSCHFVCEKKLAWNRFQSGICLKMGMLSKEQVILTFCVGSQMPELETAMEKKL